MNAVGIRPVTTTDTGEIIPAAVILGDYRVNDGYGWMNLIKEHGWAPIPNWGADGWNLGQWPFVIVAATRTEDSVGNLFGVASYRDGAVTCTYYRTEARQWDEITKHAHYWWKNGQAHAPADLPEDAAELLGRYRQPCTGLLG